MFVCLLHNAGSATLWNQICPQTTMTRDSGTIFIIYEIILSKGSLAYCLVLKGPLIRGSCHNTMVPPLSLHCPTLSLI